MSTVVKARSSSGRVKLPLAQPGMYMSFKYVQGVPARREGEGYSLYKLRMLDTLIGRLKNMQAGDDLPARNTRAPQNDEAIDFMIENYERQLEAAERQLADIGYAQSYGFGLTETGRITSALV